MFRTAFSISPCRVLSLLGCSVGALSLSAAPALSTLDREIILTPPTESSGGAAEITRWQVRAGAVGAKAEVFERLGWAYVAEARRTQDPGFYKLAEKTADFIEADCGASVGSRLLRGHVLHNLHRFADAEKIARPLAAQHGGPADYALLSDVLIEQGRLGEGIAALQCLADLKPGPEADTRIAHVRWLKGDLPGAIAAMQSAAAATSADEAETRAWIAARLSGFFLQAGDHDKALAWARHAGERLPDFPPALLALGRAQLAKPSDHAGETEALAALERAAALDPLPEYQWWLADALRAAGREADAVKVETKLRARGEAADPRTYALYLATRSADLDTAVRLARAELAQRRDVLTYDALAWALAANGEITAADEAMHAALAEGTRDARLLLHAGEVARLAGRSEEAARHFAAAQAMAGTLTPSERTLLRRCASGIFPAITLTQP